MEIQKFVQRRKDGKFERSYEEQLLCPSLNHLRAQIGLTPTGTDCQGRNVGKKLFIYRIPDWPRDKWAEYAELKTGNDALDVERWVYNRLSETTYAADDPGAVLRADLQKLWNDIEAGAKIPKGSLAWSKRRRRRPLLALRDGSSRLRTLGICTVLVSSCCSTSSGCRPGAASFGSGVF